MPKNNVNIHFKKNSVCYPTRDGLIASVVEGRMGKMQCGESLTFLTWPKKVFIFKRMENRRKKY